MELKLSRDDWYEQLANMEELSLKLRGILVRVISAEKHKYTPPTATGPLIRLVKAYLQDPIWLGEECFRLMVFVPDDKRKHHSSFKLVSSYPDGQLKRLSEL